VPKSWITQICGAGCVVSMQCLAWQRAIRWCTAAMGILAVPGTMSSRWGRLTRWLILKPINTPNLHG